MRVLYANPVFSDYRLPFYKKLNELFGGEFYVMYSPLRYKMDGLDRTLEKVPSFLNGFSYEYNGEKVLKIRKPFNCDFDSYYRFPFFHGFLKSLGKVKPDVIITEGFFQWTPMVILYSIIHRVPVYLSYERTSHTERFAPKFKIWHRKLTDKFIKGYFANGTETKRYLESLGINPEKIHIGGMNADSEGLRKGIASVSEIQRKEQRRNLGISEGGVVYLYSGQFILRKGIIYLLEAWRKHVMKYPKDHLILIGNGEKFDEYKSVFKDCETIHFMGRIPYDEVYQYYAISDVFVIPTLEDNWCLVVPEAMSCGMPVACSKYNGGAVDLIKEGENGTVFDPLNSDSMLAALDLFHGKDLMAMGEQSVLLEKPYNTENSAIRVYEAILNDYKR